MLETTENTAGLPRQSLVGFIDRQRRQFIEARPKSRMAGRSMQDHWLGQVPMHWMKDWPLARALRDQAGKGLTYMLPNAAAAEAGAWLTSRFGPSAIRAWARRFRPIHCNLPL
jgi:glutamate-1-semialdehyde 2,1-aminomutase